MNSYDKALSNLASKKVEAFKKKDSSSYNKLTSKIGLHKGRMEDKKDTDKHFGKGTFTQNRSIAKHYEKLGVPHQGRK